MDDAWDDTENYLEKRAEAELDLAQAAEHPAAVKAHYMLAGYYLDRLYGPADATAAESADEALIPGNDQSIDISAA